MPTDTMYTISWTSTVRVTSSLDERHGKVILLLWMAMELEGVGGQKYLRHV